MTKFSTFLIVSAFCFFAPAAYGANVLFIPMHYHSSHKKSMSPAAEALGKRGHTVVIWSPLTRVKDLLKSRYVEDIAFEVDLEDATLRDMFKYENNSAGDAMMWTMREVTPWGFVFPWKMNAVVCKTAVTRHWSEIEKIVALKKWDLVVIDTYFAPCAYLVANLTQAPVVAWSTTMTAPNTVWSRMAPEPFASYPGLSTRETSDLHRFSSRVDNTVKQLLFAAVNKVNEHLVSDALTPLHAYHFGGFADFERGAVQAVSQLPQFFDWPRPQLHEIVTTLLACRPSQPLPPELEAFVADPASKGTIVVAFGHMVKWKAAPASVLRAFEGALDRLKDYRIVWQYDQDNAPGSKTALHIRKMHWLPQVDLLNHAKTVVFISHAGLKSTMESVCAGVPFVAMPQFAEQYRNTALIRARKIGVFLDKFELSADAIIYAVHDVVDRAEYKANMVHLQGLIRDQVIEAIELEAFVLERAIRQTNKLRLLQNRGLRLNVLAFFSIDILAAFLVVLFVSVFISCKTLAFIVSAFRD